MMPFRRDHFGLRKDDFLVFWNNRNARRKQSGSLMYWFKTFLKNLQKKNKDAKAVLLMHTDPQDPNGQQLYSIIKELGFTNKEILISNQKVPLDALAQIYNAADCTINISDAEGFGLSTLESLSCETPIIATMTGGLQEQVTNLEMVSHEHMLKRNSKHRVLQNMSTVLVLNQYQNRLLVLKTFHLFMRIV